MDSIPHPTAVSKWQIQGEERTLARVTCALVSPPPSPTGTTIKHWLGVEPGWPPPRQVGRSLVLNRLPRVSHRLLLYSRRESDPRAADSPPHRHRARNVSWKTPFHSVWPAGARGTRHRDIVPQPGIRQIRPPRQKKMWVSPVNICRVVKVGRRACDSPPSTYLKKILHPEIE